MLKKSRTLSGLKIWQKLVLLAVFMGLPIPVIAYLYVSEKNNDINFGQKEIYGVDYLKLAAPVLQNVQKHWALNSIYARGDQTINEPLTRQTQVVEEHMRALEALEEQQVGGQKYGVLLDSADKFAAIRSKWQEVKRRQYNFTPPESFDAHANLSAELHDLIARVGDTSKLILDPDLDSYYLMDSVITNIPKATENLGQMLALTAGVAAGKEKTPAEEKQLSLLAGRTTENLRNISRGIPKAISQSGGLKNELSPLLGSSTSLAESFLELAERKIVAPQRIEADSREFLTASNNALDELFKFNTVLLVNLEKLLRKRLDALTQERNLVLALVLAGLALTIFLAVLITRGVTRQLGSLSKLIGAVENGDVDARAEVLSEDELGRTASALNKMLDNTRGLLQSRDERDQIQQSIIKLLDEVSGVAEGDLTREAEVTADITGAIADAFNFMLTELRRIIGKVQVVAEEVNISTSQTQQVTQFLAADARSRAEEMARAAQELETMAVSVQRVAEAAEASREVAQKSLATAKHGAAVVQHTVRSMQNLRGQVQETSVRLKRLGENSQAISEVVRLIEDLAHRTSTLALNASIQAATAGQAGYGFGVIAQEVEQLAQRSSDAAKRIASLVRNAQDGAAEAAAAVEQSVRGVIGSAQLVGEAGQALGEIETVSANLADLIQIISQTTERQTQDSTRAARRILEISEATQQTASGITQSALTINQLATLADDLQVSVASFKLSAPEADSYSDDQHAGPHTSQHYVLH